MADSELTDIDRAISALQDPTRRRILLDFYAHELNGRSTRSPELSGCTGRSPTGISSAWSLLDI